MISIRLTGPNAHVLAVQADAFLKDTFDATPAWAEVESMAGTTRGDPVAIAALVLSVPGAVLATMDVAARLKLAERLDRFLAGLRARAAAGDTVLLQPNGRPPLDLTTANRDQIIDSLTRAPDTNR